MTELENQNFKNANSLWGLNQSFAFYGMVKVEKHSSIKKVFFTNNS